MVIADIISKEFPLIFGYREDLKRKSLHFCVPIGTYTPLDITKLYFLKDVLLIGCVTTLASKINISIGVDCNEQYGDHCVDRYLEFYITHVAFPRKSRKKAGIV